MTSTENATLKTDTTPKEPRLALHGISKRFFNIRALIDVDFHVLQGEVVGLIGENGAGKSTLAKIIGGVHQPDAGNILIDGRQKTIPTARHAQNLGISVVHQELNLVPHLSVESNIYLGREPTHIPLLQWADRAALRADANRMLEYVGLDVDPRAQVMRLSVAQQQRVEIAKALSLDSRIIVMDEPTSALAQAEADALLEIIHNLRTQGLSIIYISHRIDEVLHISDRVVVLRDGEKVADNPAQQATRDQLVNAMVGREVSAVYPDHTRQPGQTLLKVDDVIGPGLQQPASFDVRASEVLGIAGLVGSGRTELLRAVFGAAPRQSGAISAADNHTIDCYPLASIEAGIGFVPEDRKTEGLILSMSLRENVALPMLHRLAWLVMRRPHEELKLARRFIDRLEIQASSPDQTAASLSGGNQQKTLLAKWLAIEPKILLLDDPTRGIDVGAKQEVYRLITQIADSGVAVVMVSSEMEEIVGLCDRTLVMNEGRIAGMLWANHEDPKKRITQENIMRLAAQEARATV